MTTVTLEMPDEVRAAIDEVRGEQDVASFVVNEAYRAARRRLARRAPSSDELTPADHIRMAAEAEADSLPIEEFRKLVLDSIAADAEAEAMAAR